MIVAACFHHFINSISSLANRKLRNLDQELVLLRPVLLDVVWDAASANDVYLPMVATTTSRTLLYSLTRPRTVTSVPISNGSGESSLLLVAVNAI